MNKSFLQINEWLEFQRSLGRKVWRYNKGGITANIIKHDLPFGLPGQGKSYLYIPHGPDINLDNIGKGLQNELANFIKYLRQLAKDNGSIFIKIEPLSDSVIELLYRRGFRYSKKNIQPHKTVILDLNKSEDDLLSEMHQKTRYNINLSAKKDLIVEESSDINIFWELLQQTAKKDRFSTHSKEYYIKMLDFFKNDKELQAKLFLVKHRDNYVGGAIVMIYHNTAYYLHGAMDRNYKSLMAPYFIHWNIIKYLKLITNNLKPITYYDFWGIDAKKWPGVTRFKLGWLGSQKHGEGGGSRLVEYPGSFDMTVSWFWTLMYNVARKIF